MKLPEIKLPAFPLPRFTKPRQGMAHATVSANPGKIQKSFLPAWLQRGVKPRNRLVLEIGDEWIKMIAVQEGKHEKQIIDISADSIRGANELEVSVKISAFLKSAEFQPTEVLLSYPAHNLTVRILQLPSLDPKEIADIVELQAVKQTPHSREEITTGFHILDTDAAGYSRVLVAISHRDVALRYCRILEIAGFQPHRITLSLEGGWNWLRAVRPDEKSGEGEVLLLLDIDTASSDLLVLNENKPAFTRSLDFGIRNLTAGGSAMEGEFVKEVQRSLELGEADLKDKKIGRIILTGGGAEALPEGTISPSGDSSGGGSLLKNFAALLSRETNLPSEVIAPFPEAVLKTMKHPENPLIVSREISFVPLAGLALAGESTAINLTPPEILIRKTLEDRAKDLALLGTLLLALVSLLSLVSFGKIYKKTSYLDHLKKDYSSVHQESEQVEKIVAKMKLASEQMAAGGGFLDVLQEISQVMPANITLTSFQYNSQDKTVILRGISAEMSAVFQFLTTLEGVPHLESVKTRNVTKRKVEEREVAEFEMVAGVIQLPPAPASEGMNSSVQEEGVPEESVPEAPEGSSSADNSAVNNDAAAAVPPVAQLQEEGSDAGKTDGA